jgi:cyanate permease
VNGPARSRAGSISWTGWTTWTGGLLLVGVLLPAAADACAVCFSGRDETRLAYIVTTGILTFLPLAMFGGFALWLRSRVRQREAELSRSEPAPLRASS